jgi:hypothetical protein
VVGWRSSDTPGKQVNPIENNSENQNNNVDLPF